MPALVIVTVGLSILILLCQGLHEAGLASWTLLSPHGCVHGSISLVPSPSFHWPLQADPSRKMGWTLHALYLSRFLLFYFCLVFLCVCLSVSVCVCVCVCVCVHGMCTYVWRHTHVSMLGLHMNVEAWNRSLPPSHWGRLSQSNPELTDMASLASQLQRPLTSKVSF